MLDFEINKQIINVDLSIHFKGKRKRTYSVVGALPIGLTLNSFTGVLSGTPIEIGFFRDLTVKATTKNKKFVLSNLFTVSIFSTSANTVSIFADNRFLTTQENFSMIVKSYS